MGKTEGKLNVRISSSDQKLIGTFIDVTVNSMTGLSLGGEIAGGKAGSFSFSYTTPSEMKKIRTV